MKFICVMALLIAFATKEINGRLSVSILVASPSINASTQSTSVTISNTLTTASAKGLTQSTVIYQTSTINIMPTPTLTITSTSVSSNNNTHGPASSIDDLEEKITMYLLIACVSLFVIIIIILIILVVQMKRLTNKLRR